MAEYIDRKALFKFADAIEQDFLARNERPVFDLDGIRYLAQQLPAADVAPVVHGRWIETDEHSDDAYYHHKCSNCGAFAPFDYKYREDWDEGMDGEWYFLGIIDDGINEHLTAYCPNCGAKMEA